MSTRTAMTVLDQGAYAESGPSTKTLESLDVVNGNKIPYDPRVACAFYNTSGASKTLTYSYDDERGEARTKVVTLAAGEAIIAEFDEGLCRHTGDAENGTHVWVTANGSAGDVKGRATRLRARR